MSTSTKRASTTKRHQHTDDGRGHSHGLIDRSITRSREGLKAVGLSLGALGATAILQIVIFITTGSVALLAARSTTSGMRSPPSRSGSPSGCARS